MAAAATTESGHTDLPTDDDRLEDDHESDGLSRRSLMRRSAIAGATIAVGPSVVPKHSPVGRAAAIGSDRAKNAAIVGVASLVTGPLGGGLAAFFLGDERDYDHYTGQNALRTEIHQGNLRLKETQEQVLSSLENAVEFAENVFIPKGMAAVAEALNNDADRETAEEEMAAVIDEHTAGIQEDLLKNCESNLAQYAHYVERLAEHDDTSPKDVLWGVQDSRDEFDSEIEAPDESPLIHNPEEVDNTMALEVELSNGSILELDIPFLSVDGSTTQHLAIFPEFIQQNSAPSEDKSGEILGFYVTEDGEKVLEDEAITEEHITIDMSRYDDALDALADARSDAYGELSTFVTDTYEHYEPGEVDLGDVVDPTTAYLEFSNEVDDESFSGAMAANMLGIPRTDEPMSIWLEEDEIEVEGSIYSQEAPEGGFSVGEVYDPNELDYAVMMRYTRVLDNEESETDFVELEQPFSIDSATDSDGESVDNVDVEPDVEWDTSDIESVQEQLEQIREEQIAMQNEAEGNGGSLLPTIPGLGNAMSNLVYIALALTGFGLFVLLAIVAIGIMTN